MTGRRAEAGAGGRGDRTVADLELPAMILHDAAIDRNIRVMADWCRTAGVALAPHAKTHMSRDLVERQAAAGAWGFTAATPAQVRTLAGWGVRRVLQANVLVDPLAIRWVAEHLLAADAATEYLCYVDSDAGLDLLLAELGQLRPARALPLLVELGFAGGRTGVRDDGAALALARRVAASPHVRLAGVSAFEGLMPAGDDPAAPRGAVELLGRVRALVGAIAAEGLVAGVPVVTAGGSSYPDLVLRELAPARWESPVTTVLRSGCYVTHDHGIYARTSPLGSGRGTGALVAAFELRASVLSQPEEGLAVVGFGRREAPTDDRLPVVLGVPGDEGRDVAGWEVTGVNDHHAFLRVPPGTVLAPGTVLRFGISHPCGAFDRWRHLPLVDLDGRVVGEITPAL
ncbi:alanine racemase [Cellulomonas hominis]|uniref:alanine racemase n=1 Tax=Cellulomonas hominis TaxID=156981 RepID=UPI001C10A2E7|nr:alanine racemase [Cellulomonas hominis]MBU5422865.1 alanine racemase [Cellulomonas hominis]